MRILTIIVAVIAVSPLFGQTPKYPRVNTAVVYEVDPNWPPNAASLPWSHVPGIAVDAKDNVYVFTRADPPVRVYDPSGKMIRSWGAENFVFPHHIRIDPAGNVWTTDVRTHLVQKFTPEGKQLLSLGTRGKIGRDKDHFYMPTDVAFGPDGDFFVSDGYGNARVVHYDKNGKYLHEWGELGHGPGQFSIVHAIVFCKGRLYAADRNNVRVQVFKPSGKFVTEWRNLMIPWGLWVTKNDDIWACGSSPMQWRKEDTNVGIPPKDQIFMRFDADGKVLELATMPKGLDGLERPGELNWVHCIAADSRGNLYAGDINGKRAQKFVRKTP